MGQEVAVWLTFCLIRVESPYRSRPLYEDRVVIATRLHGASPELEEITALMKKGPNTNPQLDDAAGPSSGVDCLVGQIGGSKYRVVVADRYVATVVAI